jgi:hypothetical protein
MIDPLYQRLSTVLLEAALADSDISATGLAVLVPCSDPVMVFPAVLWYELSRIVVATV